MNLGLATLLLALLVQTQTPGSTQLNVAGDFVEPLSRMTFPVRVLGWDRRNILTYPEPGGVSITYEFTDDGRSRATATAYVYAHVSGMPDKLKDHFASTLAALRAERPDAELMSEQDLKFKNEDDSLQGHLATLAFQGGAGPYREPSVSVLTLARKRNYWIKWRISAPATSGNVSSKILGLVNAFIPK